MPRPRSKSRPASEKDQSQQTAQTVPEPVSAEDFAIVGIGASAGGLEAFSQFFSTMPPDSGMAFVLVQHLDPTQVSAMPDLLTRYTKIPVLEAREGVKVQPDHAYIIPPNRSMRVVDRTLRLGEQAERPGLAHSIDVFFRSLAEDLKDKAICVVLSGTGSDGALGAKAVKAGLGMVMVQDPDTAKYDGMPRAAIAIGVADFVLPPDKMGAKLIEYVKSSYGKPSEKRRAEIEKGSTYLQQIFTLLRQRTRHDFSGYKVSTVRRRIERRMGVNQVEKIEGYVALLRANPKEIDALFKDFLINVTSFFRDPNAFVAMKTALCKTLLLKPEGSTVRAWAIGCSTGEEPYSLAIIIQECMEEVNRYFDFQVFGTDIDPDAVNTGRSGIYPASISADVSGERLKKHFVRKDSGYQIKEELREKIIFALQDITIDPPFSRMDLISARNVLIYLDGETQKKLVPVLHYALNENGILFLGTAESVGEFSYLFDVVDRKWRVYQRRAPQGAASLATVPTSIWRARGRSW